jgi:localization factor PodJL
MLPPDQSTASPAPSAPLDLPHCMGGQMSETARGDSEALEDMQQRLAQLGRQIDHVRVGLPEAHADALERIEDGIDSLGDRMAALARQRQAPQQPAAAALRAPDLPAGAEGEWDAEAAEALTRVYEMAEAEWHSSPPPRPRPAVPPVQAPGMLEAASGGCNWDGEWLEERFAELASLLSRSLKDLNPDTSLAALNRRLDQFEERLDAVLDSMAQRPDMGALSLIEAHINELTAQFEATRGQLGRLDAIDTQLRTLAHVLEDRHHAPRTGTGEPGADSIEAIIDEAAGRAASQLAAAGLAPEPEARTRIDALEGLLQDYLAERRRGEDVSAGILHTIEDALMRIIDRVDAMEAAKAEPAVIEDVDGLAMESDRLAQAYAAGARVLGQEPAASLLEAADYAPAAPREDSERPASGEAVPPAAGDAHGDLQTRHELRNSAMRAKLKAQANAVAAADAEPAAASAEASEASAEPAKRMRVSRTSSGSAGPRMSLLLVAAMVSLFGTGFLVVDVIMGNPTHSPKPSEVAQPAAQPSAVDPDASRQAAGKANIIPAADTPPAAAAAPPPPSAPAPRVPETVTDDPNQGEAATRRQARQRARAEATPKSVPVKSVPVTTATLSQVSADAQPPGGELPLADVAQALGMEAAPPQAIGPAALRYAAAGGDPAAQFEVATRFAEGKGVAQDYKQALAWYQRAASRGHASAQFRMAAYFERGIGVAVDLERAKVWYGRAAEQGHARAMHNLAVLAIGRDQATANYPVAARWFAQAAERGLADSQFNLGLLHENGLGVARSGTDAYKWYALAARSGDKEAARRLEVLKAHLAPGELATAQQGVAQWRAHASAGDIGG